MTDEVQETNSGSRTPTTPPEAAEDGRARDDVINKVIAEQVCADVLEKGKDIVVGLENGEIHKVKATSASKQQQEQQEQDEEQETTEGQGKGHQKVEDAVITALLLAAERGDAEAVLSLLSTHPNIDVMATNQGGETALHHAAASGSLDAVKLLHSRGAKLDAADRHGDSVLHWAARGGHLEIVTFLRDNGADINAKNQGGEVPLHVTTRQGHVAVLEYLCNAGANVNLRDNDGDSALHMAAWHGLPGHTCALLCRKGAQLDVRNKDDETPLHCAAARGNVECVEVLLEHKAAMNMVDKRSCTPLHLACKRAQTAVATALLEAGCALDVLDQNGESALHSAAKEGMSSVVQNMCAFGCLVDVVSKAGLTPLHFAARSGHVEVVRCLLLSGSEPAIVNKEEMTAEMMAMATGHVDVAELLNKAKPSVRNNCVNQLMPSDNPIKRIKVKVFGSSGVGKSTLIESLKSTSYIGSFFRRSWFGGSTSTSVENKSPPPTNGYEHHVELGLKQTEVNLEVKNPSYTKGIDVQQVNITSAGELSMWEFSGFEPYYVAYDHFIGDPNCVNIIVFSLADTTQQQLAQVEFWMDFIRSRMPSYGPILHAGLPAWPPVVIFIATHADKVKCGKNSKGEYVSKEAEDVLSSVRKNFHDDFSISNKVFICDANQASSAEMKTLRLHLAELKTKLVSNLPKNTGFFDATMAVLPNWQQSLGLYPVVTWQNFIEYIRARVNLLSSEEHIQEMMCQLQLCGEIIYLEAYDSKDLIVLQPQWLCTDVLGYLLSHDQQARTKVMGIYSIDEFQQLMVEGDAVPILKVLDELQLCVQCNIDGEVEYEFPCFNSLSRPSGSWEKKSESLAYGGIRITSSHQQINKTFQLNCVFPRVQVQLRHDYLQLRNSGGPNSNDCSLLQWHQGSKYCDGKMECLVICESSKSSIDVVLRGPVGHEKQLYGFMENIFDCVSSVLEDMCPGFHIERQVLSAADLKAHADDVRSYAPRDVLHAHLHNRSELSTGEDRPAEHFVDLLFFGSNTVASLLTFGTELHVLHLPAFARRQLSALLDVPDPMGRDWCLLAVMLGLSNVLPNLDKAPNASFSKTDHILYLWARDGSATVRKLIGKLEELQRADAIEIVMRGIPISVVKSALRDGSASKSHQALKYGPVHKGNKQ